MSKNSITLGKIMGIPIGIHISWVLIFVLLTWSLAGGQFPRQYPHWPAGLYWLIGLAASLLLFASVLLHELGHSAVALRKGLPVRSITLFIFGGVAQISQEPASAGTEFLVAVAGPAVSLALTFLFGLVWLVIRPLSQPLGALSLYLTYINGSLAFFNLIPGFPLDGGRILRAALWAWQGDLRRATRVASFVGQGVAYLFIFIGLWQILSGRWLNGLWVAFIGWFLDNAAQASYKQVAVREMLAGHTVREIMNWDCPSISPELPLDQVVHNYILATGRRCFPITEDKQALGLLTIHHIKEIPRHRWAEVTAREAMTPLAQLLTIGPDEELWHALQEMTEEGVNQLPVVEGGRLLGMLGRDNVLSFLRTRAELGI